MKYTVLTLLAIVVLGGCASLPEESRTEPHINTFERNNQCYKHMQSLQKDLFEYEIEKLFYSSELNTCLYFKVLLRNDVVNAELKDLFTNEPILTLFADESQINQNKMSTLSVFLAYSSPW